MASGTPDRMALQRHDVQDAETGRFVEKSWLPVNTPVRDAEGRTVGVLHHVEDVTRLLVSTALESNLLGPVETSSLEQRIRQDAAERRARSQELVRRSRRAMERMSQRITVEEQDGHLCQSRAGTF